MVRVFQQSMDGYIIANIVPTTRQNFQKKQSNGKMRFSEDRDEDCGGNITDVPNIEGLDTTVLF